MNRTRLPIVIALTICMAATHARAAAPVVTNVVAAQRSGTKLIDIHYDVFDADGDLLKVRVEISQNGGTSYSVPAVSLSGDPLDPVSTLRITGLQAVYQTNLTTVT